MKTSLSAVAGTFLFDRFNMIEPQTLPDNTMLGRLCRGDEGAPFDIKAKPDINSNTVGKYYRDDVIPWFREVAATNFNLSEYNQRWVETDKGYVDSAYVQPVKNLPNQPVTQIPAYGSNPGMWVEISVPYADILVNESPSAYWLRHAIKPRVYYGMVLWCDAINQGENGQILYRLSERFGAEPDHYYAPAEACRVITPEEISSLSPEVENKKIIINLNRQTLSAFENDREVYFCRVATGPYYGGEWSTPPGEHYIWRKLVSIKMSANSSVGEAFDTPGIGWTTLFTGDGVAIHAAYWHNEFGKARSHGCVNCLPEDAKWIWRWTMPRVDYAEGEVKIQGYTSTKIIVEG